MADELHELQHLQDEVARINETLYLGNPSLTTKVAELGVKYDVLDKSLNDLDKAVTELNNKLDKLDHKLTVQTTQLTTFVGIISVAVPLILKFVFKV